MAQRKPSTGAQKRPGTSRAGNAPVPGARTGPGARPPVRKPNKSIVNQKQTPWGLIATTVAIVVFAVVIVIAVVVTRKSPKSVAGSDASSCTSTVTPIKKRDPGYLYENTCAAAISGVTFYKISDRNHVTTTVNYPQSPPVGGNHSPIWADCDGKVYSEPIANENAVHMLEHGAVWITYNPKTIKSGDLTILENLVQGVDREALTPYNNLKTPISLQAWGYQLFVNSATDPRVKKFISVLRYNSQTTPEPSASCQDPYFDPAQSTPGHPQEASG